jgi:hypothetical protein
MSTALVKEVQEVFQHVVPRPLVFQVKTSDSWRGPEIRLQNTGKHRCNSSSFIKDHVVSGVSYKANFLKGENKAVLEKRAYDRVRDDMMSDIVSFVFQNCGSANPRLTNFYKWYNLLSKSYRSLEDYEEFDRLEDTMFAVYKYISTDCDTKDKKQNLIKVLELYMHKNDKLLERFK